MLIQTHLPEHPVMQALAVGDKDRFLAVELEERRLGEMPPFGRLAALIVAGGDAERVKAEARRIARAAPDSEAALVLGPAPAPLALLRGRYRERLLVKAAPELDLPGLAAGLAEAAEAAGRGPAAGRRRPDQLSLTGMLNGGRATWPIVPWVWRRSLTASTRPGVTDSGPRCGRGSRLSGSGGDLGRVARIDGDQPTSARIARDGNPPDAARSVHDGSAADAAEMRVPAQPQR